MLAREKFSIAEVHNYLKTKLKEAKYITDNPETDLVELSPISNDYWFVLKIKKPSQSVFSGIGYAAGNAVHDAINGVALGLLDKANNDVGGEKYEEVKFYKKDSYVVFPALQYVWDETVRLYNLAITAKTLTPLSNTSAMAAVAASPAPEEPTTITTSNNVILSPDSETRLRELKQQLSVARLEAAGKVDVINNPSPLLRSVSGKEIPLDTTPAIEIKHTVDFSNLTMDQRVAMVNAFNKIYHKLYELDSRWLGLFSLRCFRSYYPSRYDYRKFPDHYLKDVAKHAYRAPKSRTAKAYALALRHFSNVDLDPRSDDFNIQLFHDLRVEDINKRWFTKTWLHGFHLFKSSIVSSGYSASKQEITRAAQNRGRRTGIICDPPMPRRTR